jgi:hypothetical protein
VPKYSTRRITLFVGTSMVLCSAGVASAVPPKADGAASGPFYDLGTPGVLEGVWTGNTSRFGDEFDISVGTGATAAIGPRWWINWDDCARGGSSIAEVRFAMARTAASTSPLHSVCDVRELPRWPRRRDLPDAATVCDCDVRMPRSAAH